MRNHISKRVAGEHMSIDARAVQYGKVFGEWSVKEFLGSGSGGKTAVYKIRRNFLSYEELGAMKVVNIIEHPGRLEELSESRKADYKKAERELCKDAEEEIRLMHALKDNHHIVHYADCRFETWEDSHSFGTDLLIRMDLMENLRKRMNEGFIQEGDIIQIGIAICSALEECHSLGILHRDIKPDNIFRKKEEYVLGDFGISKMLDIEQTAGTRTGTRAYAAPEQFQGGYDHRADLYSLGLTLYEMANENRLPFAKSSFVTGQDIVKRLSGEQPPYPSGVGEELGNVILHSIQYHVEDRYQSAQKFADDLKKLIFGDKELKTEEENTEAVQELVFNLMKREAIEEYTEVKKAPGSDRAEMETVDLLSVLFKEHNETHTEKNNEINKEQNSDQTEKKGSQIIDAPFYGKTDEVDSKAEKMGKPPFFEPEVDKTEDAVLAGRKCLDSADYVQAVEWFKKGVARGNPMATYELALCYLNGNGVEREEDIALNMLERCESQLQDLWYRSLASLRIAQIYEKRAHSKEDYKLVEFWYRKSADAGNPYAQKKFLGKRFLR